jgi:serine/threonine protein kinase
MQNTAIHTVIPFTPLNPESGFNLPVSKQASGNPMPIAATSIIREDYSRLLDNYAIAYKTKPPYLEVGETAQNQGWMLHLSVIPAQYKKLLTDILPELFSFKVAFKIVQNQQLLKEFNNGVYGNQKVGKAITIWIEDGLDIRDFLTILIAKTENYTGPNVSTDYRICNNLYYRYGSFQPIIMTDGYGNRDRLMYDNTGNLVKDVYSNPPILPEWLANPFEPYIQKVPATNETVRFFSKYHPVQLLKSDKKGDVYKGFYYKYSVLPTRCIIKQGRMGLFADDGKTDMRDRILWQYQVMQELEKSVHVPHMITLLKDKEQSFLVMSFVNGESLAKKAFTIINNQPWWLLSSKEQKEIIGYLLQTAKQIQMLHNKGYLHRDITGTNFLVTPTGKIVLVDLELAYHYPSQEPLLPFQQGTPGYMSPQQRNYEPPRLTDDYYAIGALLLNCLTGIEPALLVQEENRVWVSQLSFFFHDPALVAFIGQCLDADPGKRPDMNQIIAFLQSYQLFLTGGTKTDTTPNRQRRKQFQHSNSSKGGNTPVQPVTAKANKHIYHATEENRSRIIRTIRQAESHTDEAKELVRKYIYSLSGNLLTHEDLWFSFLNNPYDTEVYPLNNKAFYGTLNRGVGGPLYFLSEAQKAGFDTSSVVANNKAAWHLIQETILDNNNITSGLHFGSSGIAVLLAKAIQSGILPANEYYRDAIHQCLHKESPLPDVMHGAAGDGLAVLQCSGFLPKEMKITLLENRIRKLLETQEKDGSWKIIGQDDQPEKVAGFGYGIAGIVYFLLEYSYRCQHTCSAQADSAKQTTLPVQTIVNAAFQAAERGLTYLMKQAIRRPGHCEWRNSDRSKQTGKWWCHGGPGIALTFLKAFEITGKDRYRHFAEQALRIHPKELSTHQISLCHGAAGLGEIYLEAFRVTNDEQWQERASRITDLLGALHRQKNTGEVYWNVEQRKFPTADLMTGSSGIAHFLLRWLYPGQIGFPLLPEPKI